MTPAHHLLQILPEIPDLVGRAGEPASKQQLNTIWRDGEQHHKHVLAGHLRGQLPGRGSVRIGTPINQEDIGTLPERVGQLCRTRSLVAPLLRIEQTVILQRCKGIGPFSQLVWQSEEVWCDKI